MKDGVRRHRGDRPAHRAIAAAFALAPLLLWGTSAGQAANPPSLDDALAAIARYAPQAMREQDAPGLSVAITDRTHTLRVITLGYANVDAKVPVTPGTRFPIGSITKSMTSLALMQLRDEGKFDPARPVQSYLPWFRIDSDGRPILAHKLLSHTAGLPDDYTDTPGYDYSVAALRDAHTIFAPGTKWSYSNDGYAALGAVAAALDRRPWADVVQIRVFDALAMANTSPVFTPQTLADAAGGYMFDDPSRVTPPAPRLVTSDAGDFVDPAGSVLSTPDDMAKYMRLILRGGVNDSGARVISAAAYRVWTTPDSMRGKPAGAGTPVLDEAPLLYQHYAFGFGVHAENGDRIVAHTGGIAGYTACMENDVTRGFGIIAMSNLVEAPLHPCAIVLYAIKVLQAQSAGQSLPAQPPELGMYLQRTSVPNASDYAGSYTAADGSQLVFTAHDGGLALQTGHGTTALYPRGVDAFYVDDPRFAIFGLTFARNQAHKIAEVSSGPAWFAGSAYAGPKTFTNPPGWNALEGRYESSEQSGNVSTSRVFALKGRLTVDGTPLVSRKDGSFQAETSIVRFDTPAASRMQRMWIDGIPLYRIELP